jgi:DNA-binding MarR family transcriptional regulator
MTRKETISGLEDHVGYWLRFASNHVSQAFSQKVERRGVSVAEWVLMRELLRVGPANPSHISASLGTTRGTVSKLVDRLVEKKLAARSFPRGDGRFQLVSLTPAGQKLVPVLAKLADENDREFFGHLSAEQRQRLIAQLKDIVSRHGWKDVPVG